MLGLFALAAAAASRPAISRPSPYLFESSTVVRVACRTKDGPAWGTAFYLGSGVYMTARHVIENAVCSIKGKPVKVDIASRAPDYAIVRAAYYPPFHANVSCARLITGTSYFTTGFAGTDPDTLALSIVTPTGISDEKDRDTEVNGSLVEGQSGGPVADMTGAVHAINIWHQADGAPISGVVELADTAVCRDRRP